MYTPLHKNKQTYLYLLISCFLTFIGFIQAKAKPSSNLQKLKKGIYYEDLLVYRLAPWLSPKTVKQEPSTFLICTLDQSNQLAERLAQRKIAYKQANCIKGYTIQLYVGSSRTKALQAQDLVSNFPYLPKLVYRQPHYNVQMGFFFDRLEAYFVYLTLVKKIPHAIIRPCMHSQQAYLDSNLGTDESLIQ